MSPGVAHGDVASHFAGAVRHFRGPSLCGTFRPTDEPDGRRPVTSAAAAAVEVTGVPRVGRVAHRFLTRVLATMLVAVLAAACAGVSPVPSPVTTGSPWPSSPSARPTGSPEPAPSATPEPTFGLGDRTVLAVDVYGSRVCVLRTDHSIGCWEEQAWTPLPNGRFSGLADGCAIGEDASLACWGDPGYESRLPLGTFKAAGGDWWRGCAIRTDGRLACWGGQYSHPPAGTFRALSVADAACAIRTDGRLLCWGYEDLGEEEPNLPTGTFKAVSVAFMRGCAIRSDDTIACWGFETPTPPSGTFTSIELSMDVACGLRTNRTVLCWGPYDMYGLTPGPAGTYASLSVGDSGACAMRSDGRIVCWGALPRPAPTVSVTLGDATRASTEITVTWNGRPLFEPIATYSIGTSRCCDATGEWTTEPWVTSTTPSTVIFTGEPGQSYCFDAQARDRDGFVGTASACRALPLDDRSFSRSVGWAELHGGRFFASTALTSSTKGASLTFKDLGVGGGLVLVATTCPSCGRVTIRVDFVGGGTVNETVDLYSRTRVDRRVIDVVWDYEYEGDGELATVTVKVSSSGKPVIIDGVSGS